MRFIRSRSIGILFAAILAGVGTSAQAIVSVGPDLHGYYDGCIANFTAAGLRDLVDQLDRSKHLFKFTHKAGTISNPDDRTRAQDGSGTGGETYINPTDTSHIPGEGPGVNLDPCATLYHEMHHLVDYDKGTNDSHICAGTGGISIKEVEATRAENRFRATQKDLKQRTSYGPGTQLPPDGKTCEIDPAQPAPQTGGCNVTAVGLPTCGVSNGDPHLTTFDQTHYDFQAVGEFLLVKSTTRDDLEIQVRQRQLESSPDVSVNSAVAMNVAGDLVGIYMTEDGPKLLINGKVKPFGRLPLSLVGHGLVRQLDTDELSIVWPDGSEALLYQIGTYGYRVGINLAPVRHGDVQGLLGDFNGKSGDDLRLRDGTRLKGAAFADLYPRFSDSWRISQSESMFQYPQGQSTQSVTDRRLPKRPIDSTGIANRTSAETLCRRTGVRDPTLLNDCILDVALSGSDQFAKSAANTERMFFLNVGGSPQTLSFSGQVSGKVNAAEADCTVLDSSHAFNLQITGALEREKLELFVNLTAGFHGVGEYQIGSVVSNDGQASLSYRSSSYNTDATHPGTLRVNADGHSGDINVDLNGVTVTGKWVCGKVDR